MAINPVGTWATADFQTQTGTAYKTAIDNDLAVLKQIGAAFAPHAKATPDMNVLVDAGDIFSDGGFTVKAQQTAGPFTAPVSNSRIDRVVVDNLTGVALIVAGTEAGSPVAPTVPDEKLPICQVALSVGQVAITNANISDERVAGAIGNISVKNRVTADTTVGNTTTELDIYSYNVPGGQLGTNKLLDLYGIITAFGLPGGGFCTIRFKYGGTTLGTFVINSGSAGSTGEISLKLFADGATNAQLAFMTVALAEAGVVTFFEKRLATASIDSTVAQILNITAKETQVGVNDKITLGRVHVRKE